MSVQSFRTNFGGQLSAAELRRSQEAVESLFRTQATDGNGLALQGGMSGFFLEDQRPQGFYAALTSRSGAAYAWTEKRSNGTGGWTTANDARSGTTSVWPAYEANGSTSVVADGSTIVFLIPSGNGDNFLFWADDGTNTLSASALPVASAVLAGIVSLSNQTLGNGIKTFQDKIIVLAGSTYNLELRQATTGAILISSGTTPYSLTYIAGASGTSDKIIHTRVVDDGGSMLSNFSLKQDGTFEIATTGGSGAKFKVEGNAGATGTDGVGSTITGGIITAIGTTVDGGTW